MAYHVTITTVHTTNKTLAATVETEEEAEALAQVLNEHISMRVLDPTIPALSYQVIDMTRGILVNKG